MNPELALELIVLWLALLAFGFAAVVLQIGLRWSRGLPLAPYQPRQRVPWGWLELTPILALVVLAIFSRFWEIATAPEQPLASEVTSEHPLLRLVSAGRWDYLAFMFFAAVILAPLFEETVFRAFLQGGLEGQMPRSRRINPALRRLPRAALPIFVVSTYFALMHYHMAAEPLNADEVAQLMVVDSLFKIGTLIVVASWLIFYCGATAADLGWSWRHLGSDLRLGIGAYFLVVPAIFALQIVLNQWVGGRVAPDPVPLFFLSLVLGWLYYRTHRIVPCIVLHGALNLTSTVVAWLVTQLPAGAQPPAAWCHGLTQWLR